MNFLKGSVKKEIYITGLVFSSLICSVVFYNKLRNKDKMKELNNKLSLDKTKSILIFSVIFFLICSINDAFLIKIITYLLITLLSIGIIQIFRVYQIKKESGATSTEATKVTGKRGFFFRKTKRT